MTIREIETDGWRVRLDTSKQMLGVEVPEFVYGPGSGSRSGDLLPTLSIPDDGPVSAATLLLNAKQFDDGLLAAVEVAAQRGMGRFPGKAGLLRSLAEALSHDPAATPVLTACRLGQVAVTVPETLNAAVRRATDQFLGDELASKPLGFYRWSPDLEAVFRQDRFLQRHLDPADADKVVAAIGRVAGGWSAYDAILALAGRMTNPLDAPSLRDVGGKRAFLPASRSHEVALFQRLYGNSPVPDGFNLMTELIRRVRTGEIDLRPSERSGLYDHQTWSLEPLIRPDAVSEAPQLALGGRYRQHLEDLFRGALALARETHVKQAAAGAGGYGGPRVRPVYVGPDLSVEPVPTVYARRAEVYRFLREVLDGAFGDGWQQLHRLTADGPVEKRLGEELDQFVKLFNGAAAASYRELGLEPPSRTVENAGEFNAWRTGLSNDPDVARDARMMVPVFHDVGRKKTKVWAFLGWRTVPVDVEYRKEPTVLAVESARPQGPAPAESPPVRFYGVRYEFAVPVTVELYVTRLLDRDEFRRHCDRHRTRAAILRHLG